MLPSELLKVERERPKTDWLLLGQAVEAYKALGYSYVEVPWMVSREATKLTCDKGVQFSTPVGDLVGSAEQSLLDMRLSSMLESKGKIVACSPCWREEPQYGKWHYTSFMKVELFSRDNVWESLLNDALTFFNTIFEDTWRLKVVKCSDGPHIVQQDICIEMNSGEQVELGSYGFRKTNSFSWSYGTGLAEPRLSQVKEELKTGV